MNGESRTAGRSTSPERLARAGPWFRVSAIQAPVRVPSAEWDFVSVLPAALSATQRDRPFVGGWLHRGGGAPLELMTNAGPVNPDGIDGAPPQRGLLFPAGARAAPADDAWLAELHDMTWTVCLSRLSVPLSGDEDRSDPDEHRQPSLFESTLVTLMGRRFGWLVVAEPSGALDDELAGLRSSLDVMRRFDGSSERYRFEVERAERRIVELDAYREGGLWDVRVLAGAGSADDLRQIAPVLAGSVETRHHPYRLRAGTEPGSLADALSTVRAASSGSSASSADEATFPFLATAGALAALSGLPHREVPGLRVLDAGYFDVTSETDVGAGVTVELGAILDAQDRAVGSFSVPLSTLNRHAFVAGSTGAGKSQTVRHLLEQLTGHGVPWLVIEPAKSEYPAMAGRLEGRADVTVIKPSDPNTVPMSVNPLAPEPGFPVQAHIDMVRALFQAAFDANEPFPQIMAQALQRVYEDNGWDVVTGDRAPGRPVAPAVPTLAQLQDTALQVISDVGYGRELMSDVRGFVDVRLRSLRVGAAGRFFEGGHPADISELLRRNVVLAIEDVANDEDKAFLIGTLLIRIVEHLRLRERREQREHREHREHRGHSDRSDRSEQGKDSEGLRHLTVIEEAHRLLRDRGDDRVGSHAVELFAGMLAETRAYGEGVLVAEQIPTKLVPDVVKNTALKVVHRLPAQDDRQVVGAAMNLDDDQSRQVVALPPGLAAVYADGMDRPLRVRVPLGEDRERVPDGSTALTAPIAPLSGRRSPACGSECRVAPCSLLEMRGADLAAEARDWAWLRVWVDTLVLAYVTGHAIPAVPPGLALRWPMMPPRLAECLLASVVERSVTRRARALRTVFAPEDLTSSAVVDARGALAGVPGVVGVRPGQSWVIPQLRWLRELERLFPYGQGVPDTADPAPPIEYAIPGMVHGGRSVGERLRELRRSASSVELERNRPIAWQALLGHDDHAEFLGDLGQVAVAVTPERQTVPAAEVMRAGSWLEAVLSWPHRFMQPLDAGGSLPFLED